MCDVGIDFVDRTCSIEWYRAQNGRVGIMNLPDRSAMVKLTVNTRESECSKLRGRVELSYSVGERGSLFNGHALDVANDSWQCQ